jgi:hypothetical protein
MNICDPAFALPEPGLRGAGPSASAGTGACVLCGGGRDGYSCVEREDRGTRKKKGRRQEQLTRLG